MNKVDKMIEMGLEIVELEDFENTEREIFIIENKLEKLTNCNE